MANYGYVRVSSVEQNEARQVLAMQRVGVSDENLFIDKQSGKDFNRPKYAEMLEKLKEGDLVYIKSIDRLGRDYRQILEQWRVITEEKGADIVILDMSLLDTRRNKDLLDTVISDVVLQLLSFGAENERENIRQRQAEGIAAAKARGVRFGRPPKKIPDNFGDLVRKWERKQISTADILRLCAMSRSTFYVRLNERKLACKTGK